MELTITKAMMQLYGRIEKETGIMQREDSYSRLKHKRDETNGLIKYLRTRYTPL